MENNITAPVKVFDPVCGMTPDPDAVRAKGYVSSRNGKEFFFCSSVCKTKFEANPEKFLGHDPVCKMTPNKFLARSKGNVFTHQGTEYFFCCGGCKTKFEAEPAKYLSSSVPGDAESAGAVHALDGVAATPSLDSGGKAPAKDALYTCPMHPEIKRIGPGDCPICGMALESLDPGAAQDDSEYRDMLRRFWISAILSAPIVAIAMLNDSGLFGGWLAPMWRGVIQVALAIPVVFWAAWPLLIRGWKGAISGNANMFTLIGLGVAVAFGYSLFALLFPGVVPAGYQMAGGAPPLYFEAAAVIVTLVLLGQVLELRARAHTGNAVRALLDLSPKTAQRRTPRGIEECPARRCAGGRRADGAARRFGAGRRRGDRRRKCRRRIYAHRRGHSCGEDDWRWRDRRNAQRSRRTRYPRDAGRR